MTEDRTFKIFTGRRNEVGGQKEGRVQLLRLGEVLLRQGHIVDKVFPQKHLKMHIWGYKNDFVKSQRE